MTPISSRPGSARAPASRAGKVLFALLVFVSIFYLWYHVGGAIRRHFPLPGGQGEGGPCAIWVVGSSTVHKWTTMSEDMAPWITQNRGVNGAYVGDVAARLSVEKVVSRPGTVIVYIGENDIADGASGDDTAATVFAMVGAIQQELPGAEIIVLGMKPSPARWPARAEQLRYNQLIGKLLKPVRRTVFAAFGDALLINGLPGPYYDEAGIHLNRDGYRLWARETREVVERTLPRHTVNQCSV